MAGKTELVERVAQSTGISKAQVSTIVDSMLEEVRTSLDASEGVTLRGFGTFKVVDTAPRKGRNPATGEEIDIPAGRRVSFKLAK